jgi:hypothetical protein
MNKPAYGFLCVLCLFVFTTFGCKSRKKSISKKEPLVMKDSVAKSTDTCVKSGIKKQELIKNMHDAEFTNFSSLFIKANCSFTLDNTSEDVDLKMRIIRDSLIWIHVDYLSIDIARMLITPDSIKFINYRQKSYLAEPFDVISKMMNTELDLNLLQSALLGNSAEFFQEDDKIHILIDKEQCLYQLSTLKRRRMKKVEEGKKDLKKIFQVISLHPSSFKIVSNQFKEPEENRSFKAEYSGFIREDSVYAPRNVNITLQVNKPIFVKLKYVRMEKNGGKISFSIPSRYERIRISDN